MSEAAERLVVVAVVAGLLVLGGCGRATFRPDPPLTADPPAAGAQVVAARVAPLGPLRMTAFFLRGALVRDARLVHLREPACAGGGPLGQAYELRPGGAAAPIWQRPLAVAAGGTLEIDFESNHQAFGAPAALEIDLAPAGAGGPTCLRIAVADEALIDRWRQSSIVPALGLRLFLDKEVQAVSARFGAWIGDFRHGLEVGYAAQTKKDGSGQGDFLVLGLGSERALWTWSLGVLAVSVELGYQARLQWRGPVVDGVKQPRDLTLAQHGPRLGLRPFTLVNPNPALLRLGPRLGYLSLFELFFTLWMPRGERAADFVFGIGFSGDMPLFQ